MGVAGAAIATDVSQALSALLVCIVLMKSDEVYALKIRKILIFSCLSWKNAVQYKQSCGAGPSAPWKRSAST